MINPKEIKDDIVQLFAENQDNPFVVGNGILTSIRIAFDEKKLNENKKKIATILQELGIDEHIMISLARLTLLKNGEVWNKLESLEDFQALELLLASSDACGFILNDYATKQRNIAEIGDINSLMITFSGRDLVGNDEKWLKIIRESIINNMYFFTNPDNIKSFANDNQDFFENPIHKH